MHSLQLAVNSQQRAACRSSDVIRQLVDTRPELTALHPNDEPVRLPREAPHQLAWLDCMLGTQAELASGRQGTWDTKVGCANLKCRRHWRLAALQAFFSRASRAISQPTNDGKYPTPRIKPQLSIWVQTVKVSSSPALLVPTRSHQPLYRVNHGTRCTHTVGGNPLVYFAHLLPTNPCCRIHQCPHATSKTPAQRQ